MSVILMYSSLREMLLSKEFQEREHNGFYRIRMEAVFVYRGASPGIKKGGVALKLVFITLFVYFQLTSDK